VKPHWFCWCAEFIALLFFVLKITEADFPREINNAVVGVEFEQYHQSCAFFKKNKTMKYICFVVLFFACLRW